MDKDVQTMAIDALGKGVTQMTIALTLMDDGDERTDLYERYHWVCCQISHYFDRPVNYQVTLGEGMSRMKYLDTTKPRQWKADDGGANG